MKSKIKHSYGVVPVYHGKDGPEILIVQHTRGDHWSFPKGTPKLGESIEGATIREFMEETGLSVDDFQINFEVSFDEEYSIGDGDVEFKKTNTFFLGEVYVKWTGELAPDISDTKWVFTNEIAEYVTYNTANELFENFRHFIEL